MQWYFNGAPISGATDSVYVASQSGTYTVAVIGSNGCSAVSNSIVTGVNNIVSNNHDFEIYPNPNHGKFTFNYSVLSASTITINITDLAGKLVYEKVLGSKDQVNGQFNVNCEHLTSGNYLISVKDMERVFTKKITISKN